MQTIRIFISSPGDVLTERTIAKRVIRKLQSEFGGKVRLEALLWEDLPLQAIHNFQEGIDLIVKPDGVDIAVFILWSRLGSSPGKKHIKPDGTLYRSGTEYEFDVMFEANKQSGGIKPALLAYIKDAEAVVPFEFRADTSRIKEWIDQKEASSTFIQERFYDPVSKTVWGAYHQFDTPTTFEGKLTEHLRHLILEKTGAVDLIEWEGNPYVGLRSFDEAEETLFFGRKQVVNDIESRLIEQLQVKAPSLFLLGASGSGKSSLVKAGLIPDLTKAGLIENTQIQCRYVHPSQFNGNVFDGITRLLSDAYPELGKSTLWQDLLAGQDVDVRYLSDVFKSLQCTDGTEQLLMLFLDQFEELFSDALITEDERIKTLLLLDKLVSTNRLWFLFSMRSDFYEKFTQYALLSSIKAKSLVFDVPPMLLSDIQEVVEEPARKAGLKWEINKDGIPLNRVLVNDIAGFQHSLPLVEMALSELYKHKSAENVLTFDAYSKIGGVSGSIIHYADEVYRNFSPEEQAAFEDILGAVITVNSLNVDVYLRKTADKAVIQKTPLHAQIIDMLTNKHILLSGKDEEGRSTITIIHEVLIESWQVIQRWIEKERKAIQLNKFYESQAAHWSQSGQSNENLIVEKAAIEESEHFLYLWKDKTSNAVNEFLHASIRNRQRRRFGLQLALCIVGLFIFVACLYCMIFGSEEFERIYSDAGFRIKDFYESFYLIVQVVALLIYNVIKKYRSRPVYLRIRNSLYFWGAMSLVSLYDAIISIIAILSEEYLASQIIKSLYLLIPACVFMKFAEKIIKFREIKHLWKRGLKTGIRRDNKVLTGVARIALIVLIIFVPLMSMGLLGVTINEKQEKIDSAVELNDRLFGNLSDLSNRMMFSDNQLILSLKKEYYEEMFDDELLGGTDSRAIEYAYLNLQLFRPDSAAFYTGDDYWLRFITNMLLGHRAEASTYLHKYVSGGNKIREDMLWYVELNGDFDVARAQYDSIKLKGTLDLKSSSSYLMNYAHSLLFTGSMDEALSIYQSNSWYVFSSNRNWKEELANDFRTLKWLGLNNKRIETAEKQLGMHASTSYTQPSDTGHVGLKKKFEGKWKCEYKDLVIIWEITEDNLSYYSIYSAGKLVNKAYALYRLTQNKGTLMLEELDLNQSQISCGSIHVLTPDKFEVKILENGNALDKGNIRTYYRMK